MDPTKNPAGGAGKGIAFLLRPLPVFFIVTALAAAVSGLPVIRELTESFSSPSYGRISLVIHLLMPPAVGVLAALGVAIAFGARRWPTRSAGSASGDPALRLDADERARAIQRNLPMALVGVSREGEVTFLNPAAHALFESDRDPIERSLDLFLHQSGLGPMIEQTFRGEAYRVEEARLTRDPLAEPVTLRVTGLPIRKNDTISELLLVLEDITAVKQLEEELIRSEERYRSIFNYAPCGIFFVDKNGNYIDANPAALRMLGYSLEELTRLNTREISSDSGPRIRRLLESPGWVVEETRYMRKDGQVLEAELAATSYQSGGEVYFIGIITEITRRKLLERKVADLEPSLTLAVSSTPGAVLLLAGDGRVLTLNDAAAAILETPAALARGRPVSELVGNDLLELSPGERVQAVLSGGRAATLHCRGVYPKDAREPCRMIEIALEPDKGSPMAGPRAGRTTDPDVP